MKIFNFLIVSGGRKENFKFTVEKMVNGGYSGRDQEVVRRHIEELLKEGIEMPDHTPIFFPVGREMISMDDDIEVVGDKTSGEAEFVLLISKNRILVAAGSDHTDRELEKISLIKSKQICPNLISKEVWDYNDIKDSWDNLILRGWTGKSGERILYQESKLSCILSPEIILKNVKKKVDGSLDNMLIYSGTIPTLSGSLIFGDFFEVEVFNPEDNRNLKCYYRINQASWFRD